MHSTMFFFYFSDIVAINMIHVLSRVGTTRFQVLKFLGHPGYVKFSFWDNVEKSEVAGSIWQTGRHPPPSLCGSGGCCCNVGIKDYIADPKNLQIWPIELAVATDPGEGYLWRLSYSQGPQGALLSSASTPKAPPRAQKWLKMTMKLKKLKNHNRINN